jgi:hypothetical protein
VNRFRERRSEMPEGQVPPLCFVGLPLMTSSKGEAHTKSDIDFPVCRELVQEAVLLSSSDYA